MSDCIMLVPFVEPRMSSERDMIRWSSCEQVSQRH
jgi:hypothetical protein